MTKGINLARHRGIHDGFFELGGDSILSIQVVAKARAAGVKLTPRQLFSEQTIAKLAALAEAAHEPDTQTAPDDSDNGEILLTPIQHWFFEEHKHAPHYWNQALEMTVPAAANAGRKAARWFRLPDYRQRGQWPFRSAFSVRFHRPAGGAKNNRFDIWLATNIFNRFFWLYSTGCQDGHGNGAKFFFFYGDM